MVLGIGVDDGELGYPPLRYECGSHEQTSHVHVIRPDSSAVKEVFLFIRGKRTIFCVILAYMTTPFYLECSFPKQPCVLYCPLLQFVLNSPLKWLYLQSNFDFQADESFNQPDDAIVHLHGVGGRTVKKLRKYDLGVVSSLKPRYHPWHQDQWPG